MVEVLEVQWRRNILLGHFNCGAVGGLLVLPTQNRMKCSKYTHSENTGTSSRSPTGTYIQLFMSLMRGWSRRLTLRFISILLVVCVCVCVCAPACVRCMCMCAAQDSVTVVRRCPCDHQKDQLTSFSSCLLLLVIAPKTEPSVGFSQSKRTHNTVYLTQVAAYTFQTNSTFMAKLIDEVSPAGTSCPIAERGRCVRGGVR